MLSLGGGLRLQSPFTFYLHCFDDFVVMLQMCRDATRGVVLAVLCWQQTTSNTAHYFHEFAVVVFWFLIAVYDCYGVCVVISMGAFVVSDINLFLCVLWLMFYVVIVVCWAM